MLKSFEALLIVLQMAQKFIGYLERQKLLNDDRRVRLAEALLLVARAGNAAKDIRAKVEKMTDAEVDAGLGNDYRD